MKKTGKIALGVCLGVVGLGGIAGGLTWYFLNKNHSSNTFIIKFSGSKYVHTNPAVVKFELNEEIRFAYDLDPGHVLDIDSCTVTIGKSSPMPLGTYLDTEKKTVTIPKEEVIDKSITIHFETKATKLQFTPESGGDFHDKIGPFEPIDFRLKEDIKIEYTIENEFEIDKNNSWISIGDVQQSFTKWGEEINLEEGTGSGILTIKGTAVKSNEIEVMFYPIGKTIVPNIIIEEESRPFITVTGPADCHMFGDLSFTWNANSGYSIDMDGSQITIGEDTYSLLEVIDQTETQDNVVVIKGQYLTSDVVKITIKAAAPKFNLIVDTADATHVNCPEISFPQGQPLSIPYTYQNVEEGKFYELDLEKSEITFGEGEAIKLANTTYVVRNNYIDIPADKTFSDITLTLAEVEGSVTDSFIYPNAYDNSLKLTSGTKGGSFVLNNYGTDQHVDLQYADFTDTAQPGEWHQVIAGVAIPFDSNKTICLRGNNPEGWSHNAYGAPENWKGSTISINDADDVTLSGNVMALIDDGKCTYSKEIPNDYCFSGLFACPNEQTANDVGGIKIINSAWDVLPATKLKKYCYDSMFLNQKLANYAYPHNLLPAKELAEGCYYSMFSGCKDLDFSGQTIPELFNVGSLENANYCYAHMFAGCASLKVSPELKATTLSDYCYFHMFENTGLTSAPKLLAETLCSNCYTYMFNNCASLKIAENEDPDDSIFHCLEDPKGKCENMFGGTTQKEGFADSSGTPTLGKYYHVV